MTLDELKIGQSAIIAGIKPCDASETAKWSMRRRLLELGLVPSTEIILMKTAPMGDPLEFRLRGTTLTLRKTDAALVNIDPAAIKKQGESQRGETK